MVDEFDRPTEDWVPPEEGRFEEEFVLDGVGLVPSVEEEDDGDEGDDFENEDDYNS